MTAYLSSGLIIWTLFSSFATLFDGTYLMMRPASMVGGKYHWLFKVYDLYSIYDPSYTDMKHAYSIAQGLSASLDVLIMFIALFMYLTPLKRTVWPALMLIVANASTLFRTLLYLVLCAFEAKYNENRQSYSFIDPNSWDLGYFFTFFLPVWLWVLFPAIIIVSLSRQIAASVKQAQTKKKL
jgi:hypothetical protein